MIPGPNYTQRFSQVEETPLTPSCHVPGLSPFVLFCFVFHDLIPTFLDFTKKVLALSSPMGWT